MYIDEIVVSEEYRGMDVGKKLISAVETLAKEQGAVNVQLDVWENNKNAVAFYENRGFKLKKLQYWKKI